MKKLAVIILLAATVAAAGDTPALRYHQVSQKASHNSYQRAESVGDQLRLHQVTTIEFDVHAVTPLGLPAPQGDWLTYHTQTDNKSNCRLLSECLALVAAYDREQPNHQVTTIFFDVNQMGGPGHARNDFYRVITNALPVEKIVKPTDLMAACPAAKNLKEAVTKEGCGWPVLSDVRGKFLFVVSGGSALFARGYEPKTDLVFLTDSNVTQMDESEPNRVFYNMRGPQEFVRQVRAAGFVTRVYGLNDRESFLAARKLGANLLATDCVDIEKFPWTVAPGDPADGALPWMPLP
jgi:hypothetical protein